MKGRTKILFLPLLFLVSCTGGNGQKSEIPDSPTTGTLRVFCEEGFTLPMKNQAYTFNALYQNAQVTTKFVSEKEAIEGLFNDSCKVILISRNLSDAEMRKFKAGNLYPKQTCIAKNALALIVSTTSFDSVVSVDEVTRYLSGENAGRNIVFANDNSGTATYLKDSLLRGKSFGKNCFAVKNTEELIGHVQQNKNAIGVIDYSWLSDQDDLVTQEILKKVRPLAVSANEKGIGFYPDQSNIETKDYPFCRYMHIMRRSPDFSLGAGFIAFVAGQKGQLMMLKAGLVPAFRQERVIEVNTAPLGQ